MIPVQDYLRTHPAFEVSSLPHASADADMEALIGLISSGDRDAVAVQVGGRLTGIVTIRNLLLGLSDKPGRLERVA